MDLYTKVFSQVCLDANKKISEKYKQLSDDDFKEKKNLFNGRYENLNLEVNKIHEQEVIVKTE